MKIKAEPLTYEHVDDILPRIQERQQYLAVQIADNPLFANQVRAAGPAAAFVVNGQTVALAGLIDFPPTDRALVWCIFAADPIVPFWALLKKMLRCMRFYPRRRIEAAVDQEWKAARRLVSVAGFEREGIMRAYEADGSDRELWALISGGK